jgi:hypothetical protein
MKTQFFGDVTTAGGNKKCIPNLVLKAPEKISCVRTRSRWEDDALFLFNDELR